MEVVADLPAGAQRAEPVQEREGGFDDPAVDAQAGAVLGPAASDDRSDARAAQFAAVGVVNRSRGWRTQRWGAGGDACACP